MPNVADKRQQKALDVVLGLRKGKGVRRPDLKGRLGAELRTLWAIADTDTADRVHAKVVLQLERAFARLGDDKLVRIGRVYFNAAPDLADRGLALGERKNVLQAEFGDAHRTLDRLAELVNSGIETYLRTGFRTIPENEVEAYLLVEAGTPTDDYISTALLPPVQRFVPDFLRNEVHGLHGDDGRLHVVGDPTIGDWVIVFTSATLLLAYRQAKPQFSGLPFAMTGAELLRRYASQHLHAGLVVNPYSDDDPRAQPAFSLTPAQLREAIDSRLNRTR